MASVIQTAACRGKLCPSVTKTENKKADNIDF